jgi:hypothetical protein
VKQWVNEPVVLQSILQYVDNIDCDVDEDKMVIKGFESGLFSRELKAEIIAEHQEHEEKVYPINDTP